MNEAWTPPVAEIAGLRLDRATRLDAYLPWDRLTDAARHRALEEASRTREDAGPARHWPVMVEFRGRAGAAALEAWRATLDPEVASMLGAAFAASVALAPRSRIHTAILPRGETDAAGPVQLLLDAVEAGVLERFQLGAPCRYAGAPQAPPSAHPWLDGVQRKGSGLAHTLGIIDDGCCFAHQHFRTASGGSRVHALWDQSPAAVPGQGWSALRDPGPGAAYPYGVELLKPELDALLRQHPGLGEAAELALYESIGRGGWGRGGHTHGARVMHLAVPPLDWKKRTSDEDAAAAPIVFVQLPWQTVRDVTGDSLGMQVLDGARYIVAQARALAGSEGWKATINISLGSIGGPHDGSAMAELALAELVAEHPGQVNLVMAAGNTAGDRQRIHAQRRVLDGMPGEFLLRLPPAHRRDCFVEFWFGTADHDAWEKDFSVEVVTPNGQRLAAVRPGQAATLQDGANRAVAALVFPRKVAQGLNDTMALLAIAPSLATPGVDRPLAQAGVWRVIVSNAGSAPTEVHAWVERDDSVTGRRRGQQARFEPTSPQVPDACVTDDTTLSNLANADGLITVGGYVKAMNKVAAYSANGPLRGRMAPAPQPSHYAVSDRSAWLPGLAVPGFYSGTHATINGTSAAAPQIARKLMEPVEATPPDPTSSRDFALANGPLRPARPGGALPVTARVLRDARGAGHFDDGAP